MVKKNRWVIPNERIIANLIDQDKSTLDAQAAQEILQGMIGLNTRIILVTFILWCLHQYCHYYSVT